MVATLVTLSDTAQATPLAECWENRRGQRNKNRHDLSSLTCYKKSLPKRGCRLYLHRITTTVMAWACS